jgi:hypothetical protein
MLGMHRLPSVAVALLQAPASLAARLLVPVLLAVAAATVGSVLAALAVEVGQALVPLAPARPPHPWHLVLPVLQAPWALVLPRLGPLPVVVALAAQVRASGRLLHQELAKALHMALVPGLAAVEGLGARLSRLVELLQRVALLGSAVAALAWQQGLELSHQAHQVSYLGEGVVCSSSSSRCQASGLHQVQVGPHPSQLVVQGCLHLVQVVMHQIPLHGGRSSPGGGLAGSDKNVGRAVGSPNI